MTVVVFLIDTSASMNQRVYMGGRPKLIDVAKGAVESFIKSRQKFAAVESRGDRYMLLTFEEPPYNVKAGWKDNIVSLMTELKNIQCYGMTNMGTALKYAFDLLNVNRLSSGLDTYGLGRSPYQLEPTVIIVITDGGKLSNNSGILDEFNLPMNSPGAGSELTSEPFRWDQRIFSLVLRMPGTPLGEKENGLVPSDNSPIDSMCEVTGGRSYCITTHRMLLQCIESLAQKTQSGVVVNFEKFGPDPLPPMNGQFGRELDHSQQDGMKTTTVTTNGRINHGPPLPIPFETTVQTAPWHSCRKLIYVVKSSSKIIPGYWPIPESFWPDPALGILPPRSAHPNIKFNCVNQDPLVIENLPFDKYELEPSPLTQFILARKQPTVCWQVFVANSAKNKEVMYPFGYLKASTNLTCVNLFVMPYNYPTLLPLLDEFFKVHRCKITLEWKNSFHNYLRTVPVYYIQPLRKAMEKMGAPKSVIASILPESLDGQYNVNLMSYMKRVKSAGKADPETRMLEEMANKATTPKTPVVPEGIRVTSRTPLKTELISHPALQNKFVSLRDQLITNDFSGHVVAVARSTQQSSRPGCQSYRNPFDIPRENLLDQIYRMRSNFLQKNMTHTKLVDDDVSHSMPVSQMGNYQEYLKKSVQPLREIESQPVRQHMFGNPFKIDKRMMVDEADLDPVAGNSSARNNRKDSSPMRARFRRKAGPLPKYIYVRRRCKTDSTANSTISSSPASPAPSVDFTIPDFEDDRSSISSSEGSLRRTPSEYSPLRTPEHSPLQTPAASPLRTPEASPLPSPRGSPRHMPSEGSTRRIPEPTPFQTPEFSPFQTPESSPRRTPSPPSLQSAYKETFNNHAEEDVQPPPLTPVVFYGNGPISPAPSVTDENHTEDDSKKDVEDLTREEYEEIRRYNIKIRKIIYNEVRRYGKDYDMLFRQLVQLKGPVSMQVNIIMDAITEAGKFRRKALVTKLEVFAQQLQNKTTEITTNGNA